eukprot:3559142-Amphidinium_carterae.1
MTFITWTSHILDCTFLRDARDWGSGKLMGFTTLSLRWPCLVYVPHPRLQHKLVAETCQWRRGDNSSPNMM